MSLKLTYVIEFKYQNLGMIVLKLTNSSHWQHDESGLENINKWKDNFLRS